MGGEGSRNVKWQGKVPSPGRTVHCAEGGPETLQQHHWQPTFYGEAPADVFNQISFLCPSLLFKPFRTLLPGLRGLTPKGGGYSLLRRDLTFLAPSTPHTYRGGLWGGGERQGTVHIASCSQAGLGLNPQ